MTKTDTPLHLTVERTVAATPEAVFDAWLSPDMLRRFMCPGPGMSTPKADADPRVGGRFDLIMTDGETDMPHGGVYKVIDRPNRLVFSWESPFSAENSEVDITFEPAPDGTLVRLTHTRFATQESRDNHERGWAAILEKLSAEI